MEFKNRGPDKWEEEINFHHLKLQNVVERSFGVAKNKWQMLKGVFHYPKEKQRNIIVACFALHNFVMEDNAVTPMNMMPMAGVSTYSYQLVESNAENDMSTLRDWITSGLGLLGYKYVSLHQAWCFYVGRL
ncbi:hypothetical protein C2845_PM09G13590 [Panicum miliaceum]|uniref:DDE Tnp4 domain-containing protein n=1 Tax=Panicum miliaceum TaxID=4540 RepID=A0A3L6RZ96_PANMI|nr:hypothetical protein C2845_PM09G13590 [Panicum miliaceum]